MAYNTKNIIRDAAGAPVPQIYNPTSDAYEVLQGRNGANRVELYGPDGSPISTTSGKLNVRASEIEALAGALADAAVTDPAASASIIALLKGLLKQHQGGGTIKDQVDVVDRAARALGKITADDNAIAALGALAAAAVTDPAASASVIALLKGLLKQLQGTGTGAAPVQLTGSTPKKTMTLLTDIPLAASGQYNSPYFDATTRSVGQHYGIVAVGIIVESDRPTAVYLNMRYPGSSQAKTQDYIVHPGTSRPTIMPIQPLLSTLYQIAVRNLDTSNAQTYLKVYLIESVEYENETLFVQTLPLDSGSITLAAGADYYSPVYRIPRVGRLVYAVNCPADGVTHDVTLFFYADENGTQLVQKIVASKVTSVGTDYYVINTDALAPFAKMRITNKDTSQKTFTANAYGYPR